MDCERVWREISNYVEGEVEAPLRAAMDDHFRTCRRCQSVLEGTRNVIQLYGDERMIAVPAGFGRRLEKRLAQRARESKRKWSIWSAWLVPVAALALIAGGLQLASSYSKQPSLQSAMSQAGHDIPPDMIVVVSAEAKIFHLPGCELMHNKDKTRTLTAREAMQQGYVPCVRCLRKYLETASAARPGLALGPGAEADLENSDEKLGGQ